MKPTAFSWALALFCLTASGQAADQPRISQAVDEFRLQTLKGNVHPLANRQFDRGAAPGNLPMERMLLVLNRSAQQQGALDRLLDAMHNSNSPQFHQWLTPEQFGRQFGAADEDVQTVTGWLQSHGFAVARVSKGKSAIEFSGTARQVEEAFHTAIHKFVVNGVDYWANAGEPQVPAALAPVVAGVATLHNFSKKPQLRAAAVPEFTSSSGLHALAPADYAAIYNINPLYQAGINGSGTSIAVVGRTNINPSDIASFRSVFGLSSNPPQIVVNGVDPGNLGGDEEAEAVLDTSWSGAVAPGATIKLVISKSTNAADGVDLSEEYIINNNLADVMTESFGDCEANYTRSQAVFYSNLAAQAAAQGITYLVASGDSGAAGCDSPDQTAATGPLSVNILASNSYVVAVGGTQFNEGGNNSTYWGPANSSLAGSVLSYIPEVVWNESCSVAQCGAADAALWAGGGGASMYFAKPSWQTGVNGIPADGARDVPDVALSAAGHDAYLLCLGGSCTPNSRGRIYFEGYGGTSAATPSFAGLMALVVGETGQRQGQANYTLYRLAAAQNGGPCNGSSTGILSTGAFCVFNDVTVGNNAVPGEANYGALSASYQAGAGYDLATGLGSVNAANLVYGWSNATVARSPGISLSAAAVDFGSVNLGQSTAQSVTLTNIGSAPLVFNSPIGGANAGFSWTSDCPASLAPGGSCGLSVTFAPAAVGVFGTTIFIYDNAFLSPHPLALNGSAVAPSTLTASPTGFDFGSRKLGSRGAAQTIQISNGTPGAVSIGAITITGVNAADFTAAANCPAVLPAGAACSVYAAFSPQLAGGRSASLTVANSEANSPQVIPLSGAGVLTGAFEIVNAVTGKVLEVESASLDNGALIQQNALNGQARQQWQLTPADANSYVITNVLTGKVLDVIGGSLASGTAIQQYDYLGYDNQQWFLVPADDVHYRIVSRRSGKVLEIPGGSSVNRTLTQQGDTNGSGQQLWVLAPIQSYNIVSSRSSSVLDVQNGSLNAGAAIEQNVPTGSRQQQWQFIPTGGGYYAILNRLTGKVLDVTGASLNVGAMVQQYDYLNSGNQQWQLLPIDATRYQIRSRNSGKVLDVIGGSLASGTAIQQYDYLGFDNQQWQLAPVVLYNIVSRNSGNVLDVTGASPNVGATIEQGIPNGAQQQQQWQLVPTDTGYYQIVNDLSGKVLDVTGGSNNNGTLIQQYDYLGYGNQQWLPILTDPGYYQIVSRQSGKVLDVVGRSTQPGAPVQQFDYLGFPNQQWSLTPVGN